MGERYVPPEAREAMEKEKDRRDLAAQAEGLESLLADPGLTREKRSDLEEMFGMTLEEQLEALKYALEEYEQGAVKE